MAQKLKQTQEKLAKVEAELKTLKNSNKKILSKYAQEEAYRKVGFKTLEVQPDEKSEAVKSEIETRFFNIADGLDPNMAAIMNAKIA